MSIRVMVSSYEDNPFGTWMVFLRDDKGNWTKVKTFAYNKDNYEKWVTAEIVLSSPMNVTALTCYAPENAKGSYTWRMEIEYAQCRVD